MYLLFAVREKTSSALFKKHNEKSGFLTVKKRKKSHPRVDLQVKMAIFSPGDYSFSYCNSFRSQRPEGKGSVRLKIKL